MKKVTPTQKQILNFLISINKKMDGVYVEETTEPNHPNIKFEATIASLYVNPCYWSPTQAFFDVIKEASEKHLKIDFNDFGWNNTRTTFWYHVELFQTWGI